MSLGEAIGLVAMVTLASAFVGLVTSRLTAHWLKFGMNEVNAATLFGAVLGFASSYVWWGQLLDRYRYEDFVVSPLYLSLVAGLTVILAGCSTAFIMLVCCIVKSIVVGITSLIDKMFAKSN